MNILECHGVVVKLFADDVKVYLEICNVEDAAKLQKALNLIAEWAADSCQCCLSCVGITCKINRLLFQSAGSLCHILIKMSI